MSRYRRRPEEVTAEQFLPDRPWPSCVEIGTDGWPRVKTGGPISFRIRPGNWIVTDERGIRIQMRPDDFAATYQPI